jgi:protein-disulfide isomerase
LARRPTLALRPTPHLTAVVVVLLAISASGCAQDANGSQDLVVVPSDARVARDRADQARVKGDEDAPIRIVEISDFECPFCRQYYEETMGALDSLYIQTGKVRYVWISYANPGHSRAWPSIEAAFCAGAVGKFWPMHDVLFERQGEWSSAADPFTTFVEYAEELGIDPASFGACMRDDLLAPFLLGDYTNVMRAGISSTPYFILADSVAIRGAAPIENFRTAIDELLALKDGGEQQEQQGEQQEQQGEQQEP